MLLQGSKVNAKRMDVEQGSAQWLELRRKHVCASDSLAVMGLSKWCTRQELLEQKRGLRPETQKNYLMQRGIDLEPLARQKAEEMLKTLFIPEVYVSYEYPWMLASLDGVCIDNKMILEIKCPNRKTHEMAKNEKIPDYYYAQVQHQIAVCDTGECYYASFDGKQDVAIVIVKRDDEFIKKMIGMEYEFYQELNKH